MAPESRPHPEEHFLPLFSAPAAAGEDAVADRLHASATFAILRMVVYAFRAATASSETAHEASVV